MTAQRLSPRLRRRFALVSAMAIGASLQACGGGGGTIGKAPAPTTSDGGGTNAPARVFSDPRALNLRVSDVEQILAQAVGEAAARGTPATIAIVDRVGNVLAVYQMAGAPATTQVPDNPSGDPNRNFGVQGAEVPSTAAAISQAVTGAYLSSNGNAFTSRTASMIVQEHFPPAPRITPGLESGPLFGVQFSQLPCSDLSSRYAVGRGAFIGPNRAPLGLSADPGGLPIYKDGVLVGGIGVSADEIYDSDPDVTDFDTDDEEAIALAGTIGFDAPTNIRANRITVDGTSLRYTDMTPSDFASVPSAAAPFASLTPTDGALVPVTGYFGEDTPAILAGTTFGQENSGIRRSGAFSLPDIYVLSDGFGNNRFIPRGGTDAPAGAAPLSTDEVTALLEEAFGILQKARAQIRRPLDSRAQVTVSVVDTNGQILGIVRSPDAPIFGIDVSLQKARTAALFSGPDAASDLLGAMRPDFMGGMIPDQRVRDVVARVRQFLDAPDAMTGTHAFADRSGGNLARPFFPDGEAPNGPGPLSVPIEEFSPFSTGLQSDLIQANVVQHALFVAGASPQDTPVGCTFLPDAPGQTDNRLANGLQIFPGSVPIYRGDVLIGGIGVSGDGIDQDDMISFLGLHNAGLRLGGAINNAPPEIRADRIVVRLNGGREVRLRFINCPFSPFVDDPDAQNVCQGK